MNAKIMEVVRLRGYGWTVNFNSEHEPVEFLGGFTGLALQGKTLQTARSRFRQIKCMIKKDVAFIAAVEVGNRGVLKAKALKKLNSGRTDWTVEFDDKWDKKTYVSKKDGTELANHMKRNAAKYWSKLQRSLRE